MSGPNPNPELPTSYYRSLILDRVCDYIQGAIPLDFVSTRVVRKEYWTALYDHLEKFETKDFPLRTVLGLTAKTCRHDWRLSNSPKHAAFLLASALDKNRNTRAAMQLLPVLFARELAACNNKWPEALYQADRAAAAALAVCPVRELGESPSDEEADEEADDEEAGAPDEQAQDESLSNTVLDSSSSDSSDSEASESVSTARGSSGSSPATESSSAAASGTTGLRAGSASPEPPASALFEPRRGGRREASSVGR